MATSAESEGTTQARAAERFSANGCQCPQNPARSRWYRGTAEVHRLSWLITPIGVVALPRDRDPKDGSMAPFPTPSRCLDRFNHYGAFLFQRKLL